MSLSVEGQKCPACQGYLFDDDDIVYCPVCGAPHHRDCYLAVGHCAMEEYHGTEKQYDAAKEKAKVEDAEKEEQNKQTKAQPEYRCVRCGTLLKEDEPFCPNCHTPRGVRFVSVTPFGVHESGPKSRFDGETVVEDDVKLKELVPIISVNAVRYSDKFVLLNRKNKLSWNWAAFLVPAGWSFYRKSYKSGILFLVLMIAGALLSLPFEQLMTGLPQGASYVDLFSLLTKGGTLPTLLGLIGGILNLGTRIIAALFGDYIYRGVCIEKAKIIRASADEKETLYYKLGGVSPVWFMVAVMIQSYAPMLLTMFF